MTSVERKEREDWIQVEVCGEERRREEEGRERGRERKRERERMGEEEEENKGWKRQN